MTLQIYQNVMHEGPGFSREKNIPISEEVLRFEPKGYGIKIGSERGLYVPGSFISIETGEKFVDKEGDEWGEYKISISENGSTSPTVLVERRSINKYGEPVSESKSLDVPPAYNELVRIAKEVLMMHKYSSDSEEGKSKVRELLNDDISLTDLSTNES